MVYNRDYKRGDRRTVDLYTLCLFVICDGQTLSFYRLCGTLIYHTHHTVVYTQCDIDLSLDICVPELLLATLYSNDIGKCE